MGRSDDSPWAYTRAQRWGLILLVCFLFGGALLRQALEDAAAPPPPPDDHELLAAAERLRAPARSPDGPAAPEGFAFDPNTVSRTDLQRLGLSPRQTESFVRYRERVTFRTADDLRRLRLLRPDQLTHLLAWAQLKEVAPTPVRRAAPPPPVTAMRFPFDPNTLGEDSLRLLGFSDREVNALLKYRSYRTPTFSAPEDLYRVRALDSQRVTALLDLVRLPFGSPPAPARRRPPAPPPVAMPVDVNRATAETWTTLPGIGPARAARIVAYREALGGFHDVQQVAETYGLPDSVYRGILPRLAISAPAAALYVNRLDANALARHPYLDRRTATILVRYRANHGPFAGPDDLKKVRAVSTETLAALLPYLNFEP